MAAQPFSDPELLENLDHLETQLIGYETGLDQGKEDTSRVQFLFRYAHNLKSSLGMLGYADCSRLLHKVESCFDLVRNAKRRGTVDLTKASLMVVDTVRDNLEAPPDSPLPDTKALVDVLEAFLAGADSGNEEDLSVVLPFLLTSAQARCVTENLEAGRRLWVIDKLITTNIDQTVFGILPCFDQARALGPLVAFDPPWERIPQDRSECVLRILVASDKTKEQISKTIRDSFRPVRSPSVARVYRADELSPDWVALLKGRGYSPAAEPLSGPALLVVSSAGSFLKQRQGTRDANVLVLAVGNFRTTPEERLEALDCGADAVVTGGSELAREALRLESLFYTAWGGAE